jgi:tetratricopeptide (TPR) repeat protein
LPDQAIEHLEAALKLDSNLYYTHFYLGIAHNRKNQHEKALEHFLAASDLAPWDPKLLNSATNACYALGRKEEAIRHYISSLWIDKKQVRVLYNISVLYMETGQTERAIEHLEPLVELEPDYLPPPSPREALPPVGISLKGHSTPEGSQPATP